MSEGGAEIIPYLFYDDVGAALDWLSGAFGFVEQMRRATPGGGVHAEMQLGGRRIMMGQPPAGSEPAGHASPNRVGSATQGVFVYLADVDAHHARAAAFGAEVVQAPLDRPFGRTYTVRDLGGHPWFFTTPPTEAAGG